MKFPIVVNPTARFPVHVTRRMVELLRIMRDRTDAKAGDGDAELVYDYAREKKLAYLGLEPVAPRTVFGMLRACAITSNSDNKAEGPQYYRITETGRQILKDIEAKAKPRVEN